jgi:nicotinamidase-related amidase
MLKNIKNNKLLFFLFLLGLSVGILLQYHHIPGNLLFQASTVFRDHDESETVILKPSQDQIDKIGNHFREPSGSIFLDIRDYDGREYSYHTEEFDISKIALVLIDVWPGENFQQNVEEKIIPIVNSAREHGMLIIHSPNGRDVHELIGVESDEVCLDDINNTQRQMIEFLNEHKISHLFYAGYLSNMCVLNRPTGIPIMADHGYKHKIIFIRDASLSGILPGVEQELLHQVVTSAVIELNWASSTTVDDFLRGFSTIHGDSL